MIRIPNSFWLKLLYVNRTFLLFTGLQEPDLPRPVSKRAAWPPDRKQSCQLGHQGCPNLSVVVILSCAVFHHLINLTGSDRMWSAAWGACRSSSQFWSSWLWWPLTNKAPIPPLDRTSSRLMWPRQLMETGSFSRQTELQVCFVALFWKPLHF